MNLKQIEKISKALGDVNRLKILQYMQQHEGKVECTQACNLLTLAQPSISHHIKKLVEADLILQHKVGRNYNYTINQKVWDRYQKTLAKL
ncbi:helix-turn-helix transcriptional regulator [Marixanthomonas sp. SCSIO 43207]|uniref:ArsR/SmtB family transcription factor n=1 Tax=Marixanthomonas sp. SCSIO 43207 TaxID=2779360 RepID=UPI001CA8D0DD|nr:helix-turn-helix domain-containing protein [Marixanthomonas sp. SCSIO 43207]UAB82573.1 helix-turn-helix transcriptional regulator [Marixanthomonas sp. SCSIO 43207]